MPCSSMFMAHMRAVASRSPEARSSAQALPDRGVLGRCQRRASRCRRGDQLHVLAEVEPPTRPSLRPSEPAPIQTSSPPAHSSSIHVGESAPTRRGRTSRSQYEGRGSASPCSGTSCSRRRSTPAPDLDAPLQRSTPCHEGRKAANERAWTGSTSLRKAATEALRSLRRTSTWRTRAPLQERIHLPGAQLAAHERALRSSSRRTLATSTPQRAHAWAVVKGPFCARSARPASRARRARRRGSRRATRQAERRPERRGRGLPRRRR